MLRLGTVTGNLPLFVLALRPGYRLGAPSNYRCVSCCSQGGEIAATSRDPVVLDASTHLGAMHDTDYGQVPRVPVQLELMLKTSRLQVAPRLYHIGVFMLSQFGF